MPPCHIPKAPAAPSEEEIRMQFGLSEEQDLIVSTVRSFVETEIYPLEDEIDLEYPD